MRVFYFGCWGGPGHYVWTPNGRHARPEMAGPWTPGELDAPTTDWRGPTGHGVTPVDRDQKQGVWRLSLRDTAAGMWTAIGAYDRTEDRRFGSVAVFVAEGEHGEEQMKRIAAEHFPAVWARITGAER